MEKQDDGVCVCVCVCVCVRERERERDRDRHRGWGVCSDRDRMQIRNDTERDKIWYSEKQTKSGEDGNEKKGKILN